jgi:hypothetical protein
METENKDWKPEVGKTAWYFDPNEKNVIREGNITDRSEVNSDHYWLLGSLVRHYTLLFPSPEAALASIKIYDLEGKEVVIPPRPLVLEPKPLEWKESIDDFDDDRDGAYCHDGDWAFIISQDQSWEIYFLDEVVATDCGHQIEAKAAIQEWRVNHLKSILP